MQRTKTSLATFCSLAIIAACGKRGDPLPPLRPTPAGPEGVSIAQIGDRILISWTSPVRNTDGTVEKLELADAVIVRRVIDIDALIAEQTKVVERTSPAESEGGADPETEGASVSEAAAEPTTEPGPGAEAEPATTPGPGVSTSPQDTSVAESAPGAVSSPPLVIPPFPGEGAFIETMESSLPGVLVEYEDPVQPGWIGKRLEYGVAYLNRRGRQSPYGTTVAIEPEPTLPAPSNLEVESSDGFVAVGWTFETTQSRDEEPVEIGFSVYRRPEDGEYPDRPLNGQALLQLSFQDRTVLFGTPICYEVRAVKMPPPPPAPAEESLEAAANPGNVAPAPTAPTPPAASPPDVAEAVTDTEATDAGSGQGQVPEREPEPETEMVTVVPAVPPIRNAFVIASEPSPEQCLTPFDRFAPATPADVVAVTSPSGILLTWRLVNAADLGGYRVYRSESRDGPFEAIGKATVASFNDAEAPFGQTLYYAVTAFDTAPEPNESPRSEVVEATRPPGP